MNAPFVILGSILVVAAPLVLWRLLLRSARRWAKGAQTAQAGKCRCGYPLEHLSLPRCPECGRVTGFDATPEELGLTDDHLRRVRQVRQRRQTTG